MDVTTGSTAGAAPATLDGDWPLVRDDAAGRWARRFTFALPTAGLADGLRWQPGTGLTLSLPALDYDARAAGAPEGVTVANSGDGVRLTFPVPRTLRPGESVAFRVTLGQASLIQGATLELVALAGASGGRVRLQQDAVGVPGAILGEGELGPLPAGVRHVARVDFAPASVAGAGPVWVSLQCEGGGLLWLTAPTTAAPGPVLRRAGGEVAWTDVSAASERGALVSIVTGAGSPGAAPGHAAFHGVQLHLAGVRLRGSQQTGFNLATALAPLLQSAPAGLVPVSLSLLASEPARVTVYPPEFEFDP